MTYVSGDLRDHLAYVGRDVVRSGLVVGSGGNLSAREPGGETCWATATGSWLDRLERPDFVRVCLSDGSVVSGGAAMSPAPTSELALHLATYRARPDVNAVVHLHPQTLLLLDALGERVRLVTTDHAYYVREVVRTPFALPGGAEVAALAADAAATGANCVVLAHHGCSVLADTVELAHKRARNLEEAAQLTYRALLAGALDRLAECPPEFTQRLNTDPGQPV